ncbi:MAG: family 43 glycosylhydrolase [Lentisphaeria bacterium]|nr:family 43 glycosylhydrolase [Lentisphaeria bacterium]
MRFLKSLIILAILIFAVISFAEIAVKNNYKIAFLGDSITAHCNWQPTGYVNLVVAGLKANGIETTKINAGISGHKSNQMLSRLEKDVLSKNADVMFLSCGVNDVWHQDRNQGVMLDDYCKNVRQIIDTAQQKGVQVYLLAPTLISENFSGRNNQKLLAYVEALQKIATEKNCKFINLNSAMRAEIIMWKKRYKGLSGNLLTTDGVHMNILGNMFMAREILKGLNLNNEELRIAEQSWQNLSHNQGDIKLTAAQALILAELAFENRMGINDFISRTIKKEINNKMQSDKYLFFGDPFILLHNNKYYAYGTNHADGILVYESDDLKNGKLSDNGSNGFAFHKSDSGCEKWFWAPEVYPYGDKFLMYLTCNLRISCAVADSPTGKFVQVNKMPMYAEDKENRIDNSLFIDDDGKAYIYFNRWVQNASEVWGAELEKDLVTIKEDTLFHCITPQEKWETIRGRIAEGPFMLKHDGKYYITYSANSYKSPNYAIGYAVADNPKGPFVKAEENPILCQPLNFKGSGHHSFFTDKDGKLRIVFHVHRSNTEINPRYVVIGDVLFENGKMKIGDDFIVPREIK